MAQRFTLDEAFGPAPETRFSLEEAFGAEPAKPAEAEPTVDLAPPPGGFVTPGGAAMVPPRLGRKPPGEDVTAAAFRDPSRQRDIPPAAPVQAAPTQVAGPEMRPWEPTLWERFLNLFPGDRAKAANEALARRIAKEQGIPVDEAYRRMKEAVGVRGVMGTRPSGQPMFNPEGRAPIKAVTEAAPYVAEGILDIPKGMAESALRAYRAGDIESSVDAGYVDRAITRLGDDAKDIFIPNLPERMGLRRDDPNYQGFMGLGKSLGYSLTTMVASAITGTGATAVTGNPVVGVGTGMATSGTLAYRASKDDFLDRLRTKLNNDSKKVFNRPLSNAEWDKAKKEFNSAAVEYGAWEAIPEAISNAIFLKAFAAPVKGAPGAKLAGYIQKANSFAAENLTETATGMGQNAAELKAGLTEDEITIADAFKQQFIQTALTMGVMAGGMKGKDLAIKFYNEQVLPKVDPASALAKAIKADIDAVAFSPQAIKQEAAYLARTGAQPRTLEELARQRPVAPVPPGGEPAGEEPPEEPAAPPAAARRVEPELGEAGAAPEVRAEPTFTLDEAYGPEPEGRVEPRLEAEALPVVGDRAEPRLEGAPSREVPTIPGMPTGEELAEPPAAVTPVTQAEAAAEPTVTPVTPAPAVVQPTPAAAALPETPTVPPVTKPKTFEPTPDQHMDLERPIVNIPVKDLKLSEDVPQFKYGANKKGVVEPLGGKFTTENVAPIAVWQRLDGSLEVISGRHRFDLAQRSGTKVIPSQIYYENQGFTAMDAAIKDAELNIRDDQGKVKDYVNYFRESSTDRQTAESKGFLARDKGKRGFTIANQGSDELIDSLRADQVGDEAAFYIALNAPNDARLQGVGIKAVMDGKSANTAVNMMQAVKALAGEQDTTTDMFGFDDSAMREAEEMAKIAARKQREIQTRLSAISGAAKNPAVARAEGIDIKDPEAVKRRIDELRQRKAAWDNWSTSPELIAEIRSERGVAPPMLTPVERPTEPLLTAQTPEDLRERAEREAAEAKRKTLAEQELERKERADRERDEFVLTGSDRPADEAAARGQEDLFAAPPAAAPAPTPPAKDRNVIAVMPNGVTRLYREQDGIARDDLVQWKYAPNAPAKVGRVEHVQDAFTGQGAFAAQIRDQQGGLHLVDTKQLTKVGAAPKIRDVVNDKQPSPALPAENRLVLMPCCDMKGPERAPAMELYKGVFFQTFKGNVKDGARPNVVILSAKHGFISPTKEIEPYDQVMDKARADEMLGNIRDQLRGVDFPRDIKDVLIVGGKEYQRVMRAAVSVLQDEGVISMDASVNATSGGIGDQRKQLGEYLRSIEAKQPERKEEAKEQPKAEVADSQDRTIGMTKEQYRKDKATRGQSTSAAMGVKPAGMTPKTLLDKHGEKNVRLLARLYGVEVKDKNTMAQKLIDLFDGMATMDGYTKPQLESMTLAQLKPLANDVGTSANGSKAEIIKRLMAFAPEARRKFEDRLQDLKHRVAVTNAVRQGKEVSDEVLKDYPELVLYARERGSDMYNKAARDMALKMTSNLRGMDMPAEAENLRKSLPDIQDPKERQVTEDVANAIDALHQKMFGEKAAEPGVAPDEEDPGFRGASDEEVADVAEAFKRAKESQDAEINTRVFDAPKKADIVRIEEKARIFVKDAGYLTVEQAKQRIEEWKRNAEQQGETGRNSDKIVLSLFDMTGEWSKPWEEAGYQVFRFDIQTDPEMGDVNKFSAEFFNDLYGAFEGQDVYAILAACPCTDFASSGARHFAAKDADGRTVESVELVQQTLRTVEYFKPSVWAIENPVGRIEKLTGLPPWRLSFNPNHFGDPYTKKTLLWGRFNANLPIAPVEPVEGSKMHRMYGGKSQETKNARSVTPEGFAYAFFQANNAVDNPVMALANKYDMMSPEVFREAVAAGMTYKQVSDVVDDPYYMDLDYAAAEEALRAVYSRPYTEEQRAEAQTHADEVGGEIAWQQGDYALIRGYSLLSGDPVYIPTMGSSRARVDIESFTGKQLPDGVRQEMIAAKKEAERVAEANHKRDPFVVFDGGVAISSDIPQDLAGVIREWKDLLKLNVPIFVGTVDFAKENRNNFTGPHRRIGSGTLDPNERGSMRRMGDGSYYILFKPSTSRTLMLETIAHEMGHVHERLVFEKATPEEKRALQEAHMKWVESQKGKTAQELVEALRGRSVGRAGRPPEGMKADDMTSYWRSFGEWYADQVSRWAVTAERPVGIVEKYFKRLAIQLRRFYQQLRARKYLPDETFVKYIEAVTKREANLEPPADKDDKSSQIVELPKKEVTGAIDVDGVQRPLANSNGQRIHPTEEGTRKFWRWFGDSQVVDAQGRPLVVYHGTGFTQAGDAITTFQLSAGLYGAGAYFSGNPQRAANYAKAGQGTIYPVYVRLVNPISVDGYIERFEGTTRSDERAWDARQELMSDGIDGVLSEPRGPTRFWEVVAFRENQIKSAIGNLGTFSPDSPSIIQNIEPSLAEQEVEPVFGSDEIRKEQIKEYATLRARLARVPKEVAAGKASLEMQATVSRLMQRARELQADIKATKPRRDSAEQFLAKALTEYDAGNISAEVLEVIDAAYRKTPDLLEGLLLRVRAAPKGGKAAGDFDPWERIVRLYKGTSGVLNPSTIRHELAHTLEQMMTPEQRMAVVQAWGKALSRAIKQNPDELHQKYFNAVLDFLDNPTPENYRKAQSALPSYEMYQFINPSEFWAVNAEKLMAAQLGGAWDKFKRAVRRMWEGVKKVLGFDNRSDIHKVFNQVMGGSRERMGKSMLVDMVSETGGKFVTLENIEDDKKLVEKYNRPKTPMLNTKPIATFVNQQFKNGKEFVQDAVANPREAMVGAGDSVMDGLIYLRNKNVWYGSGLEARDFDQYNGELRTSEGIATASVALDNAIRSGNIGVEVIFRGGIEYDTKSNNFVAVNRRLGMKGVYEAEGALKKKLGDQLGTDIIQGYLEAKRSISIMDELYDREAAFEAAKDTLKMLRESGAEPDDIAQAKAVAEAMATDLDNIKKAVSSVNMSEDEMYEFAALDQKHPELRQIMDNWTSVNQNLLKFWRQVGLISQGRYETLAAIKDYVPWYRIMADEEDVHSPLQSTTRALTNIGREKLFKRGKPIAVVDFRATAGQKDFKIQPSSVVKVEVNGEPVSDDLVSVTPDGQVRLDMDLEDNDLVVFKTNREIENIIDNMTRNVMRMTMNGIRQFAANRIVMEYGSRNASGKIMTFPSVDKEKGRFNWVVNGKKVVVEIQDPLVAASIYGMENLNLQMWKPLAMVANLTRRSITLSGVFQIKQVFKDAPTAALVTGVKNPLALIGGVWKGFLTSLTETDPAVDILKAAGIGGFHSPARTPEAEIKRRLGIMNRNVFSALIKGLDHIGDASDMAQRVATYKRVLAETGDETQALFQAANVINFLHHGSAGYAQAAVKVVPFLGAYANAMDVLVRALVGGGLKGMSRKKALARLGITMSVLVSLSVLYAMLAGGDPEYDELDDQTKLKNIIIPGTKIMLPMNTSAAYFFKAIPELIYNVVTREGTENEMDRRRIRKALADASRDMLLGPEPIPAGVKPVLEVAINHDFFTGRTVIPEGLKDVQAAEQYTATTSELGKKLSAMLAIPGTDGKRVLSPIEADHIIRGVFGTAGAMGQWVSNSIGAIAETRPEPSAREAPITGSFLREDVPRGREDLFYDFKDVVFEKYKTWQKMIDREDFDAADAYLAKHGDVAAMYEYINETEAELKDINAEIRRLGETRSKEQTPKERREQIDEFKRLRNEILDPVKELRREVLQ